MMYGSRVEPLLLHARARVCVCVCVCVCFVNVASRITVIMKSLLFSGIERE